MITEHDSITQTTICREFTAAEKAQHDIDAQRQVDDRWAEFRMARNLRLSASDWTQIADAPVDAKAWAAYRQALRDLPATIDDPTQPIDWPEAPK